MEDLVTKTAKVVQALEGRFGVPQWRGRRDPLDVLIRAILSQNTNDDNLDKAYNRLKERFPTWKEVRMADPRDIAEAIRPGGLANQKSRRIKDILVWIESTYGELNLDFLCKMDPDEAIRVFCAHKGIGIKTISVVLAFACGKDVFPVDTHVHRITRRLGLVPANAIPEKTHWLMKGLIPPGKSPTFHLNLLRLGRTICRPKNPLCDQCPLWRYCEYRGGQAFRMR